VELTDHERQRLGRALGYDQGELAEIHVQRQVGKVEMVELLRDDSLVLLIEDYVSENPLVVGGDDRFDCWKREIRPHLVEPDVERFCLDDFSGQYCYTALLCQLVAADGPVMLPSPCRGSPGGS